MSPLRLFRLFSSPFCLTVLIVAVIGFPFENKSARAQDAAATATATPTATAPTDDPNNLVKALGLPPVQDQAQAQPAEPVPVPAAVVTQTTTTIPPAAPAGTPTAATPTPPEAVPPAAVNAPSPLSAPVEENVGDLLKKIENDPATQQQAVVLPTPLHAPAPGSPLPPGASRMVKVPTPGAPLIPNVPAMPAAPDKPNENMFFDSESLVPHGEMRAGAPRDVNPRLEPASKLIVVKKDYDAASPQAQMVFAQRAIALKRYDSALRIYQTLYKNNPKDPNTLLGLAVVLQQLGQNDDAVKAYNALLDVQPDNIQAQINMAGLVGERYPAVALQKLKEMSDTHPDDVGILAQIAVIQARMGNYNEAMTSLGMAASLDTNNASHVYNMAVIADRAGQKKDAITYYEKALEIDTIYGSGRSIPRDQVFERLARLR